MTHSQDPDDLELRRWLEDGKAPAGSCPYCASRISMVQRDGWFRARCSHRGCGAAGPKMRSITRAADLFCCPPQRTAAGTPKRRSYRAAWMAGRYATAESRIASIGAEIDRTLGEHAGGRISALEAARDRIATLEAELAQVRSKLKEAADLFIAIQATDGEEEHRAICDPAPKPRPRGAERVRP